MPADEVRIADTGSTPTRVERRRALIRKVIERFGQTILWRWLMRLLEIEFLDRATAIAAKAFVALIPLVAVILLVLPDALSQPWFQRTAEELGVSTSEFGGLSSTTSASATFGVLGLILLVYYATSFGTSLQRLYRRAWRRPASSRANRLKVLEWLTVFVLYSTLVTLLASAAATGGRLALTELVQVAGGTLLWTWTARLLLGRDIRWRALWLGGLLTQAALMVYSAASLVWVPKTLDSNVGDFGAYGAAVTLLAWLIGCAFIVVVVAGLSPVIAETDNRFGRFLSGGDPLEPGAADFLPPPATSPLRAWLPGAGGDET